VISVPAYFNEKQRQSVINSASLAGIEVAALINEPTAAGLSNGLNEKQGDRLVVIADFGQGTFDCSLVGFGSGQANVLASHGDNQLGGKDVDEKLLDLVRDKFLTEHSLALTAESHPADLYQIWQQVVHQKERLSSCSSVKICARVDGKQIMLEVTREMLAAEIKPLIDRAEKVIDEALTNAKVNPKEVTQVLPIGGSSRLAAFQEMLKRKFGADRIHGGKVSPDMAVAEGAAIHAAKLVFSSGAIIVDKSLKAIPAPAIKATDVMPHSLGVSVQDPVSRAESCSTILEKNQPLPCSANKQFGSVTDDQRVFVVSVLQGEDSQPVKDCLIVGQQQLELPPRPAGRPTLEVNMGYDNSGMVNVVFKDLVSGKQETITVDFFNK
jgi:molecular chaperone DnaK (HSP70)